jgi:hypothetical protein
MAYANVEKMLIAWLPTVVTPTPRVGVATPADPSGTYSWLPFIRVQRVGGSGNLGVDQPRIVLDFFAADYASAYQLAASARLAMEQPLRALSTPEGAVIQSQTDSAPSWVPYDDVRVERFQSHHTLVVHSMK